MPSFRQQRWHLWRNVDATSESTCPPFGCVEITGWEFEGATLILLGRSATGFDETYLAPQGPTFNHAFNNEASVITGRRGLLTFDLPAWGALMPGQTPVFGSFLTFGKYLSLGDEVTIGEPWRLGIGDDSLNFDSLITGFNTYHVDAGNSRAFVGGIRTFIKDANGVAG